MIIFCHLSLSPYSLFIHLLISLFGFISSFWGPRRVVGIGRVEIVVAAIVVAVVVVTYLPSLSTPLISPLIVGIGMVGIVAAVIVAVVVVVTYLPWLSTPSISPLILDILLLITIVITQSLRLIVPVATSLLSPSPSSPFPLFSLPYLPSSSPPPASFF